MKGKGNGSKQTCIENLLKTFKAEVPYARNKGVNPSTLDLPDVFVRQQMVEDAENVIDQYETRVNVDDVFISSYDENGTYKYSIMVSEV